MATDGPGPASSREPGILGGVAQAQPTRNLLQVQRSAGEPQGRQREGHGRPEAVLDGRGGEGEARGDREAEAGETEGGRERGREGGREGGCISVAVVGQERWGHWLARGWGLSSAGGHRLPLLSRLPPSFFLASEFLLARARTQPLPLPVQVPTTVGSYKEYKMRIKDETRVDETGDQREGGGGMVCRMPYACRFGRCFCSPPHPPCPLRWRKGTRN